MIAVLGATGKVGAKVAERLIEKREPVRLIARSEDRLKQIAGKHAEVMAGDAGNKGFLVKAFTGVDAVFVLIPPNPRADSFMAFADRIGDNITASVEAAGVKHAVFLSSVGAEVPAGTGPIAALHRQEMRLNQVRGLNALHVRAAYFMENLLANIDLIRSKGIAGSAIRGDFRFPMTASKDIADFIATRLLKRDFTGSIVRYVLGQRDLSLSEAAAIIGGKIGKPGLAYVTFPYGDAEKEMVAMGLSPDMSRNYVEMSRAFNEGRVIGEPRNRENTTPTSIETFCDEVFVPLYGQKKAA